MWVVIIIALTLLLGGGGAAAYVIIQNQSSPTATLQKLCDGFKNKDAQEIYETFSSRLKAQPTNNVTNIQRFLDSYSSIDCTIGNVQQNGSTATGALTFTATRDGATYSSPGPVALEAENSQWKISNLQL